MPAPPSPTSPPNICAPTRSTRISKSRRELLDQFRVFLSDRQIRPGLAEWLAERDFVSNRLKTELFNQAFGVEKGDEVEAQRDPVILKALEVVTS